MKREFRNFAIGALVLGSASAAPGAPEIEYEPLHFGGLQEFGSINEALLTSQPSSIYEDEWVDHLGVWLTQGATVDERLYLQVGLGGIFQFPKNEKRGEIFGGSQYKMFYFGPTVAKAMYSFGDPDEPVFRLGAGMFPYKYNPDASNLGEYLFRTGAYPTFIKTGGFSVIGSNAGYLQGVHGAMQRGGFSADFFLLRETGLPPLYDWSLAAVAQYRAPSGLFNAGLGLNWKGAIAAHGDSTAASLKDSTVMYFTAANGQDYVGELRYYREHSNFYQGKISRANQLPADDPEKAAMMAAIPGWEAQMALADAELATAQAALTDPAVEKKFFPSSALLATAWAGFDFKPLFGWEESMSPADFRLYAEVGILGVQDYPVFYEKITERMPVMVGFNVPTFGLLDLLAVQFEQFNSPNINSTWSIGNGNRPIPDLRSGSDPLYSTDAYMDITERDNQSWSVLAQKKIGGALSLSVQAARDHLRTVGTDWWYDSKFEPNEILIDEGYWYWMVQLGWNI